MKKLILSLVGGTLAQVVPASPNIELDRAWMRISDPLIMSMDFNHQFDQLPRSGEVSDRQKYWSSDYWARYKGGINYRWNGNPRIGFNLRSPTRSEALVMSETALRRLAPSEKWDLFLGRYDYPTRNEVDAYASPSRPTWEGICDGWAGAALNHDEPVPSVLTNPDGVRVPFGSSDVKALLSWYYAKKYSGGHSQMGRRCNGTNSGGEDRCDHDMNAGAFHVVLANKIGVAGSSFIADMDRRSEVWNHIPYRFRSRILSSNLPPLSTSAPGTVKMVRVRTTVDYVFLTQNSWTPVLGTSRQELRSRTYEYYLDLSENGRIIGGEWISTQRPDFLWLERKASRFTGLFSQLPLLLKETPVLEELAVE
jgi:hypothetical protein